MEERRDEAKTSRSHDYHLRCSTHSIHAYGTIFISNRNRINMTNPVIASGTFFCSYKYCRVTQKNTSKGDVLFYGADNGMYCKKHLIEKPRTLSMRQEHCPRCVEEWENEEGAFMAGEKRPSDCAECGVCVECEHLIDCSKSN